MIPTQEGDQPRHAPAPDHAEYMQPAIPQVSVAFDPSPHAVVRLFVRLMFDELLFILNFVINVFYDCHRMFTKAMRRLQKGWSVCSTLGWSLQAQSYMILCKIASRSPGGCQCKWKCQGSTETVHKALIIVFMFCS